MTLQQRVDYLTYVFDLLQDTNSRTEKEQIVKDIDPNYKEDFDFVIECLAGKHKFGYTYKRYPFLYNSSVYAMTVKSVLQFLLTPAKQKDLSMGNIAAYVSLTTKWADFFEPIVNRTLRLGIGESLIEKSIISPMLAKKFDGNVKYDKNGYYITEKLDGNRCRAYYENGKWQFISRSGKQMHVNFDMSGLDERLIYDGEITSPEQVKMSLAIEAKVKYGIQPNTIFSDSFSSTSGLINRHTTDKNLVYNVFDIVYNASYKDRREELDRSCPESEQVRILPVLKHCKTQTDIQELFSILNDVTDLGGEGLMINLGSANYLHKRTDQLLKLKKVYTIDMKVIGIEYGTGKYEGQIGAIICKTVTDDGNIIQCKVGTGLSDEQRLSWSLSTDKILNKIVEISYFSTSQEKNMLGTNQYSLRFPRLKRVRDDKTETSQY